MAGLSLYSPTGHTVGIAAAGVAHRCCWHPVGAAREPRTNVLDVMRRAAWPPGCGHRRQRAPARRRCGGRDRHCRAHSTRRRRRHEADVKRDAPASRAGRTPTAGCGALLMRLGRMNGCRRRLSQPHRPPRAVALEMPAPPRHVRNNRRTALLTAGRGPRNFQTHAEVVTSEAGLVGGVAARGSTSADGLCGLA